MLESLRCGARTRSGKLCQAPAIKGKKRCRMHGGAARSGAPKANRNALKHGLTTREAIEQTRAVNTILRRSRKMLDEIS
jgi:glucans biosynthesis protein